MALVGAIDIPGAWTGGLLFSPGGHRLAIGLVPGAGARLADVRTGELRELAPYVDPTYRKRWPHPAPIVDFAFTARGTALIGLTFTSVLLTWHVPSGELARVRRSPAPPTTRYQSGPFGSILMLRDGRVAQIAPAGAAVSKGPRWVVTAIPGLIRAGIETDGGRDCGVVVRDTLGEEICDTRGHVISRVTGLHSGWTSVCGADGGNALIACTTAGRCQVWRRAHTTGLWRQAADLPSKLSRPDVIGCSADVRYAMLWSSPPVELALPGAAPATAGPAKFNTRGGAHLELLRLSDGVVLKSWTPHTPVPAVQAAADIPAFRVAFAPSGELFALAESGVASVRLYSIGSQGGAPKQER